MSRLSLIFAFERRYLLGFIPLVRSLERHSPRLAALDRIVLTTDRVVANAPEVRSRATLVRLIEDADLEPFRSVIRDRIPEHKQDAALPRTSMLKWFAYDDYGYDGTLVLDTDILNTRNADDLVTELESADLVGCPLFPPELRRRSGRPLEPKKTKRNVRNFVKGQGDWSRRLNSGVLLFNRKLMSADVRLELVRRASENAMTTEQRVLRTWADETPDIRLKLLTPKYNFNASFLASAEPEGPGALFRGVRFLHYVGDRKPWSLDEEEQTWVHRLWPWGELPATGQTSSTPTG